MCNLNYLAQSALRSLRIYRRRFKMSGAYNEVPIGVRFVQKVRDLCCPRLQFNRELCYRTSVVFLTFIAYMCYHLSRKPISVVKAVLHRNCSDMPSPGPNEPENWCDWAPFDGSNYNQMLGELDSAFLFSYAAAMFISGFIAERVNLRYFLSIGMLMSGIFSYLFGIAKTYDIHSLPYYVVIQALAGVFQTTGWPGVVTVMSNWFGNTKKGLIFGLWNSHTSIGNILGSLVAARYVETDWAMSFIMPGLIIGMCGVIIFLFLVVSPSDVGCASAQNAPRPRSLRSSVANLEDGSSSGIGTDDSQVIVGEQAFVGNIQVTDDFEVQRRVTERTHLLACSSSGSENQAIGFLGALRIPGVVEYSLCLFFSKLVSYTFLFWLPLYVNKSTKMNATLSADLSTLFDVGGIVGSILTGYLSDRSDMPATTCVVMLTIAAPMMFIYQKLSYISLGVNIILLLLVGLVVNGPYTLITTAVSADLGTHHSLEGNCKALATVTAIIDGTGSIGAAVGPLLAGFVTNYGWENVFYMLIIADLLALVLLLRLVKHELIRYRNTRIRIE